MLTDASGDSEWLVTVFDFAVPASARSRSRVRDFHERSHSQRSDVVYFRIPIPFMNRIALWPTFKS